MFNLFNLFKSSKSEIKNYNIFWQILHDTIKDYNVENNIELLTPVIDCIDDFYRINFNGQELMEAGLIFSTKLTDLRILHEGTCTDIDCMVLYVHKNELISYANDNNVSRHVSRN